ncbi:MAG: zinc ribbon domain-containing protein, partial [Eubacteriales bacterium]
EPELFDGKHKGIISVEQFEKAREITESLKKAPAKLNTEMINPFAGILVCADCGRKMKYQHYPDIRISRFMHVRSLKCHKKSLSVSIVTDAIVDALLAHIDDCKIKIDQDNEQAELIRHRAAIDAMEAELARLEKQKRRLFDSWEAEDGMYTKDEFIERKQRYAVAIDNIKKQIREAKETTPEPVNFDEQITNLHAMIECIRNPNIPAKEKNDFLKQFIDVIKYDAIDYGRKKGGKPVLEIVLK